jgi:hypothetical protein
VPLVSLPRDPAQRKVKNKQDKIAGARSKNTLISRGARRSLLYKTSTRGGADQDLRKKTGCGAKTRI